MHCKKWLTMSERFTQLNLLIYKMKESESMPKFWYVLSYLTYQFQTNYITLYKKKIQNLIPTVSKHVPHDCDRAFAESGLLGRNNSMEIKYKHWYLNMKANDESWRIIHIFNLFVIKAFKT